MEKATFGAGCFWSVEAAFRQLKGVKSTSVGYMGRSSAAVKSKTANVRQI
jgi:peptide methionine sulfoxide reductase MsrA